MNIRTRSGNTAPRADLAVPSWLHLHGKRGALCSALAVLLVVSCSQGDARDERQFEAREAEKTQQVPLAQQTELATTFLQPTGTPEATFTPIALLSELVVTTSLDSTGGPANDVESVPASTQSVILAARLANLVIGETITMELQNKDGEVIASGDQPAQASSGPQWYTATCDLSGVSSGTYAGAVRVNGELLNSIVFTVG
jgi:hypothetical protein